MDMARWFKCLLYESMKKPGMVVHTCDPNMGKRKQESPRSYWPAELIWPAVGQPEILFYKTVWYRGWID